jgi:hypothetical protein
MLRSSSARLFLAAVAVVASVPFVAASAAAGDFVEGAITTVDLHGQPRHISIQQAAGGEVDVPIHVVTTHLNFVDQRDSQIAPELSNLRAGMYVRAQKGEPSPQIDILSIPQSLRAATGGDRLIRRNDPNADPRTAHAPSYPPLPGGGAGGGSQATEAPKRRRP